MTSLSSDMKNNFSMMNKEIMSASKSEKRERQR